MQINPGKFNKKIQIISRLPTKDADGFSNYSETIKLKTWAQITNISRTELQKANSDFSEVKTRFFMRKPKVQIDHSDIIKFCGKEYDISYINNYYHDGIYTEILAKAVEK